MAAIKGCQSQDRPEIWRGQAGPSPPTPRVRPPANQRVTCTVATGNTPWTIKRMTQESTPAPADQTSQRPRDVPQLVRRGGGSYTLEFWHVNLKPPTYVGSLGRQPVQKSLLSDHALHFGFDRNTTAPAVQARHRRVAPGCAY